MKNIRSKDYFFDLYVCKRIIVVVLQRHCPYNNHNNKSYNINNNTNMNSIHLSTQKQKSCFHI